MRQFLLFIILMQLFGCNNPNVTIEGIPFEYKNDQIILSTKINDTIRAKLIFDTGSGSMILDSSFVSKSSLSRLMTNNWKFLGIGNAGFEQCVLISDSIRYQVGSYMFSSKRTCVTNLKRFNEAAGISIDGFIGYPFLKNSLFKIDFDRKRFYLDSIKPLDMKNAQSFRICGNGILINIEIELVNGTHIKGDFLLDYGCGSGLIFTKDFALKNNLDKKIINKRKLEIIYSGFGGKTSLISFRAKKIIVGNVTFTKPIIDYSLDTTGLLSQSASYIGYIGIDLLSRTNMTFDFKNKLINFEPANNVSYKFERSKTGLSYMKIANINAYKVNSIYESVSIKSGLCLGDTIIKANNIMTHFLNIDLLDRIMKNKVTHMTVLRKGKEVNIRITPENRI